MTRSDGFVYVIELLLVAIEVAFSALDEEKYPWADTATLWGLVVLVGFSLFVLLWTAKWLPKKGPWKELTERWNSLDLKHCRAPTRFLRIILSGAFRWFLAKTSLALTYIVVILVLVLLDTVLVARAHSSSANGPALLEYLVYMTTRFVGIIFVGFLFFGVYERLREQRATRRIRDETMKFLEPNKPIHEVWHDVADEAEKELLVVSVNARDLLTPTASGGHKLGEFLGRQPESVARLLVADPSTRAIRIRNACVNGRFCSYYAQNFLKLMLWWEEVDEDATTRDRVEIRTFSDFPSYRLLLSEHAGVVQRYELLQHGRDDQPVRLIRFQDPDPRRSLYAHYRSIFDQLWREAAPGEHLKTWQSKTLKKLARQCGVSRKERRACGGSSASLVKAIAKRLEL